MGRYSRRPRLLAVLAGEFHLRHDQRCHPAIHPGLYDRQGPCRKHLPRDQCRGGPDPEGLRLPMDGPSEPAQGHRPDPGRHGDGPVPSTVGRQPYRLRLRRAPLRDVHGHRFSRHPGPGAGYFSPAPDPQGGFHRHAGHGRRLHHCPGLRRLSRTGFRSGGRLYHHRRRGRDDRLRGLSGQPADRPQTTHPPVRSQLGHSVASSESRN